MPKKKQGNQSHSKKAKRKKMPKELDRVLQIGWRDYCNHIQVPNYPNLLAAMNENE